MYDAGKVGWGEHAVECKFIIGLQLRVVFFHYWKKHKKLFSINTFWMLLK